MYNAEEYTISVRQERIDEEVYWVARVEELPDILEFAETRDEAYELAIDTIQVGQEMCLAEGSGFPAPKDFSVASVSGRVTLRLRKTTHAKAVKEAEKEGVSLNAFLAACIEKECGNIEAIDLFAKKLHDLKRSFINNDTLSFPVLYGITGNLHTQTVKIRKKIDFESLDGEDNFTPKTNVLNFLINQDSRYAYD